MSAAKSRKPYLVRAIYEWCSVNGYTPYISVKVNAETRVPPEYVRDGEIVLNISHDAAHRLTIGDDIILFSARFSGVSRECAIPMGAIIGIFPRELPQEGLFFEPEVQETPASIAQENPPTTPPTGGRPKLQVVK